MKDLMKDEVDYFVAWMQEDNEGQPTMSYEAAREVYKYRVFRDDGGTKSEPVTEAMTYQEAKHKLKEINLLTIGS
jgi:hypothetical protein